VSTLERHFNAIDSGATRKGQSLSTFVEPISNLITHTKLIWMNTKHFHKDTARFKLLMDAVEKEINHYIRKLIKVKLFKVEENNFNLSELMTELTYGKLAAETFEEQYKKIKKDVKEENSEYSWEDSPEMFKETGITRNRIVKMIEKFKDVDAHAVLIDTELTQVIGDANFLKESKEETFKMFMLFKQQADRLFDRSRQGDFEKLVLDFESDLSNLDIKISKALNEQSASVRSSIDKFKMLEKFKSIYKVLKDESADNFTEVLEDYTKVELHN